MALNVLSPAYDELIKYLAEKATPQEILEFELSEAAQERASELTELNQSGLLTIDQQIELEQMVEFDQLIAVLKARALKALR